jgi:hypothetical protein
MSSTDAELVRSSGEHLHHEIWMVRQIARRLLPDDELRRDRIVDECRARAGSGGRRR